MPGGSYAEPFVTDPFVQSVEVARAGTAYECIIRRSSKPYVLRGLGRTPDAALHAAVINEPAYERDFDRKGAV